jgi:hypothetical protein
MASTIAAVTTGGGGIVQTADASGNLSLLSGANTVVAVTSTGVAVTGTLSSSGASTFTGTGKFATTIGVGNATPSASGSGITFPATQSASSDANTLDDYEEGTWTPVLTLGGAAGVTTYDQQNGTYTKVGNAVTARCYIAISTKSAATGTAQLTGLPFVTLGDTASYQTGCVYMAAQLYTGAPMCYIAMGSTSVTLGQQNGATGFVSLNNANFVNSGDFIFQATYRAA